MLFKLKRIKNCWALISHPKSFSIRKKVQNLTANQVQNGRKLVCLEANINEIKISIAVVPIQYSGTFLSKGLERNLISVLHAMQISHAIEKDNAAFFLLIEAGKLTPPKAAKTLATKIVREPIF